jgi:hypothetical protein
VQAIDTAAAYASLWTFGSGHTADRWITELEAFSSEECTADGATSCQLR